MYRVVHINYIKQVETYLRVDNLRTYVAMGVLSIMTLTLFIQVLNPIYIIDGAIKAKITKKQLFRQGTQYRYYRNG